MRLINCHSLQLQEFHGRNVPYYAILSHTWDDEEVSFEDFGGDDRRRRTMRGWDKIQNTAQATLKYGLWYCWVDTCCIDKRSSTELSEAINSMFTWYRKAQVCFTYLADFDSSKPETLSACRWFTRGWTLQEFIAPSRLKFYDRDWNFYDTKIALREELSEITGVDPRIFSNEEPYHNLEAVLKNLPVCQKMSWAAKREVKHEEDIAYCLLGLFGVNMPLLYGEGGEKAFLRLQEEIIKNYSDLTILGKGMTGRSGPISWHDHPSLSRKQVKSNSYSPTIIIQTCR
ncbi:HET-domain-containing protein [Whalleya microplaca]|nr:HET-domain-containing protein [Whalleya microplaca]